MVLSGTETLICGQGQIIKDGWRLWKYLCAELYPPSSRPAAMGTTLNSWLALSSSTCFSADECLSLFSAFKLRQFLYQSIWPPPSPPQSGFSLKLNQHDVFSSSLPSFVCFSFMIFFFLFGLSSSSCAFKSWCCSPLLSVEALTSWH